MNIHVSESTIFSLDFFFRGYMEKWCLKDSSPSFFFLFFFSDLKWICIADHDPLVCSALQFMGVYRELRSSGAL